MGLAPLLRVILALSFLAAGCQSTSEPELMIFEKIEEPEAQDVEPTPVRQEPARVPVAPPPPPPLEVVKDVPELRRVPEPVREPKKVVKEAPKPAERPLSGIRYVPEESPPLQRGQFEISGPKGKEISGPEGKEISGREGRDISGPEGKEISGPEGKEISGPEGRPIGQR